MCEGHFFGGAAATRTLITDYGAYHVCDGCAATLRAGGYVVSDGPLKSDNTRQRCQCEHVDHFTREAAWRSDDS